MYWMVSIPRIDTNDSIIYSKKGQIMETKSRILYLQKILLERTDEGNPLSTTQLINILNDEYGNICT